MSKFHDPIRHLEYLRQSLSQDKKPIGFFISAGCPLAVEMQEGKSPLIPDVKGLTELVSKKLKENKHYKILLQELKLAEQDDKNIENILSFIRGLLQVSKGGEVRGLTEEELKKLDSEVCKNIVEEINVSLPNYDTPYHSLSSWISSIEREIPIEIYTTNYDLLMEQALEEIEVPYFDGFVGARRSFFDLRAIENNLIPIHWTRLWKIHGSINWYLSEEKNQKIVYRSSEIKIGASHLIYPSHLKYEQSRKMPYLAMIDQLNKYIRQKSSFLIISGYSFNDEHLNDTIINALKSNPTAMVLGLMFESYMYKNKQDELVERYPKAYKLAKYQHNLNIWTYDKAIIGTNLGEWKSDSNTEDKEILKFIHKIKKDESESDSIIELIKMGDFQVFTSFLKTLIGIEKENPNDK